MAMPEMSVVCTNCGAAVRAQPKRTLLAFLQFKCPTCQKNFLYPLTKGYRVTYWVIVSLMVVIVVLAFAAGRVGFPGIIGLLSAYALYEDSNVRKKVAAAEFAAQSKTAPDAV